MKELFGISLICLSLIAFAACDKKDSNSPSGTDNAAATDNAATDKGESALKDGKWPEAIYAKYGFDQIDTKGKIVYTDFSPEGPFQYQVFFHGVTQDELKSWVDKLTSKGLRIHDRDKERLNGKYNHDTMIYTAEEKQPYRMRLSYDFSKDMDFEYYSDEPNPAFTVTEKKEGDEVRTYIYYNLSVALNPLNTDREFTGSFDSLGLKAEDLKVNDNVRSVVMSENANGGTIKIRFYYDHLTTKEEFESCRNPITDKLAEKGAKFTHSMSGKDITADELKQNGIGSYSIEMNDKKFLMMVDQDSEFGEFGGSYGVRLMLKK